MSSGQRYEISYGKLHVPLYRAYARPLSVAPIPESRFSGRGNQLVALEVDVEVFGDNFLPAYTQGDNSMVVATDSMKNIVLRQALEYDGATLEGYLAHVGRYLLASYPQMQALRVSAREMPFDAVAVPGGTGGFAPSETLFGNNRDDRAHASLDFARDEAGAAILTGHRCCLAGMRLLKVTGSAFTRFVRDAHTTLPERGDRPLYVFMDLAWTYANPADLLAPGYERYVPAEQVRDLVCATFAGFVSESIQHLVHEMGTRLLVRFPQLASVSFDAQNHTPDPVAVSESDPRQKVYAAPFPAYGNINLTMRRGESDAEE
jgi:urate oxidase / 2-oxo-4-hydroxy-4-carboxy-5-ureidoimidazoline decarboxylase